MNGAAIAQRALAQIGTPFRLHGRCAGEALDCVGLVAVAINVQQATPFNYSLRGDFEYDVIRFFDAANFHKCGPAFLDGDIVLVEASPRQLHLMVAAKGGFVHAHAGLRKITFRLQVGDWILNGSNPDRWRITEIEHLRGVSRVSAMRSIDSNPSQNLDANPGRNVTSPDISAGETRIILIDLPVIDTNDRGKPLVAIAAAGTERGWRQAALSLQQGDMLLELGSTSGPAATGFAITELGYHSIFYTDTNSILDVELLHEGMAISPIGGLFWLNGELLRYGQALYLGNNRYRLTQLQRGCYGSEGRTAQHQAGDPFLFLDPDTLRILDDVSLSINQQLTIEGLGIGDTTPVLAQITVSGHATLPFAPVHLGSSIAVDNGIELTWVRRSRIDYGWNDGVDQPLVEESEAYFIEAFRSSVLIANWNSNEPRLILPPSQIAALQLSAGELVTFFVRQIGRYGQSAPAELAVTIH